MDRREIIGDGDLAESYLAPENPILHASMYDSIFVCEKFSEAVEEISGTFACFIRFWERYGNQHEMTCWISKGFVSELPVAKEYLKPPRDYLGEWKYKGWPLLARQISQASNRTFVIKREWLPKLQELILG